MHDVLEQCLEQLAGVLEDARYEQRDGYTFLAFPTFPVRDLNGMWVDSDAAVAHIEAARAEAQELGTPFSIMVREGRTPGVERAAVELGFEPTVRIPGMAVTPSELREPEITDCEVIRVETADGLAEAMAVGAAGFGISADLVASIYSLEVAELDGLEYYLRSLSWTGSSTTWRARIARTSRRPQASRSAKASGSSASRRRRNIAAAAMEPPSRPKPFATASPPGPSWRRSSRARSANPCTRGSDFVSWSGMSCTRFHQSLRRLLKRS
jgi:hypothetical protein